MKLCRNVTFDTNKFALLYFTYLRRKTYIYEKLRLMRFYKKKDKLILCIQ